MAISDKLQELLDIKQAIKTALETKGIPMTNVAFTEYANKILDISGGGEVDEYFYYSKAYYTITNNSTLFLNAWESSLIVNPVEISENSTYGNFRGTAQYPNGEIDGVIIPQGITKIGNSAFNDWQSINKPLLLPNSVTIIGAYAFYNWQSNKHPLVIPSSVTNIGSYAFGGWSSNNQPLVIPNSVTSIANNAFSNWSLVPYVEMQRTTPPSLANANAFEGQNNAPIYVPDESVDDYKTAARWVFLASRIFPISDK